MSKGNCRNKLKNKAACTYVPVTTAPQNCIINDQNSLKSTETHNNNNLTPQNIDLVSNLSQVKKKKMLL